ncbi:MAG: hypothetical protein ABIH66_13385 [bacterium]
MKILYVLSWLWLVFILIGFFSMAVMGLGNFGAWELLAAIVMVVPAVVIIVVYMTSGKKKEGE